MASRILRRLFGFGTRRKQVAFTFFPQNTDTTPMTVANGLLVGDGVANVTRTGQGVYLATLEDCYKACWSKHATIQLTSVDDRIPQFGDISNLNSASATPVTVVIRNVDGSGTAQEMTANANNSISVTLEFEDSDA